MSVEFQDEDKKHKKKPDWIRSKIPVNSNYKELVLELKKKGIFTVCEEANCPNRGECWEEKTATLMILGDVCTRACKFCNVKTGNPQKKIDHTEIQNAVEIVRVMGLNYVVITSVDRDDLPDFGASHFASVVQSIKNNFKDIYVEVLIPDFNINEKAMHVLAKSSPFVIAQNIEVVERITSSIRDKRAGYHKTLTALSFYKKNYPQIFTKSSIMVGVGEMFQEVVSTMKDLKSAGVDIITIGQYLRPDKWNIPVEKYYTPEEFDEFKRIGLDLGIKFIASGPMVRSSYRASDYLKFIKSEGAR